MLFNSHIQKREGIFVMIWHDLYLYYRVHKTFLN